MESDTVKEIVRPKKAKASSYGQWLAVKSKGKASSHSMSCALTKYETRAFEELWGSGELIPNAFNWNVCVCETQMGQDSAEKGYKSELELGERELC